MEVCVVKVNTEVKRGTRGGDFIDFLSIEHPWDVFQSGIFFIFIT